MLNLRGWKYAKSGSMLNLRGWKYTKPEGVRSMLNLRGC